MSKLLEKIAAIAIKPSHVGLLHKKLGVPSDTAIPEASIQKAKQSKDPSLRREATFAENAKHWKHK